MELPQRISCSVGMIAGWRLGLQTLDLTCGCVSSVVRSGCESEVRLQRFSRICPITSPDPLQRNAENTRLILQTRHNLLNILQCSSLMNTSDITSKHSESQTNCSLCWKWSIWFQNSVWAIFNIHQCFTDQCHILTWFLFPCQNPHDVFSAEPEPCSGNLLAPRKKYFFNKLFMKAKQVPDSQNKHGPEYRLHLFEPVEGVWDPEQTESRHTHPQTLTHACVDTDGGREWNPQTLYLCSPSVSGALTDSKPPFILPACFFIFHKRADFRRDWRRCCCIQSDSIRNPEDLLKTLNIRSVRLLHITLLRLTSVKCLKLDLDNH